MVTPIRVIMYQPKFAGKVERRTKRQTVRPKRKREIKPGDFLSHRKWLDKPYRSKQVVLVEAFCISAEDIELEIVDGMYMIKVGREYLYENQGIEFARADGFTTITEMFNWFEVTHGLPFRNGVVIKW